VTRVGIRPEGQFWPIERPTTPTNRSALVLTAQRAQHDCQPSAPTLAAALVWEGKST